jgi:hypothetical protein
MPALSENERKQWITDFSEIMGRLHALKRMPLDNSEEVADRYFEMAERCNNCLA